jgi:hypothetical protein
MTLACRWRNAYRIVRGDVRLKVKKDENLKNHQKFEKSCNLYRLLSLSEQLDEQAAWSSRLPELLKGKMGGSRCGETAA